MKISLLSLLGAVLLSAGCADEPWETLALNGSSVWIAGKHVTTPQVRALVQDGSIWFRVGWHDIQVPIDPTPDLDHLLYRMLATFTAEGMQSTLAEARRSTLVESVEMRDRDRIVLKLRGHSPTVIPMRKLPESDGKSKREILKRIERARLDLGNRAARRVLDGIETRLKLAPPVLVVVGRLGGVAYFANQPRALAEAQIAYVLSGKPIERMPAGPLGPGSGYGWVVTEIFVAKAH